MEGELHARADASSGAPPPPLTPLMRQYLQTKAQHPDALLFFRLGDFYEMFYEDAVLGSRILQIALTSRSKGDERVPMCGVPHHAAKRYISKLVAAGHRVAICEQVEDPSSPGGLMRREVSRLVTPGMLLEEGVLEPGENNFLAAVYFGERKLGGAVLDASTGEFSAFEAANQGELADQLGRYEPKELLVCEEELAKERLEALLGALRVRPSLAWLDRAAFDPKRAGALLRAHFRVASLDGFGLEGAPSATSAAGAALRYLKSTQKSEAAHVDRLSLLRPEGYLLLDEASRANLEIVRSAREGGRAGSLLGVLDRTATALGARKLSRWLTAPLQSIPEIQARQDAIEQLVTRAAWREEIGAQLRRISDLERLCARLSTGNGTPRDLRAMANSLQALPQLASLLERFSAPLLSMLARPLGSLNELEQLLGTAMVEDPPPSAKEGGFIRRGVDRELDELIELSTSGKDVLLRIESRERERTGISSLKVRYNKVFGYYLEVTRPNLHLVPSDFIRRQTTVGAERFVTAELQEHEERVLSADEKRCALELKIYTELCDRVSAAAGQLRAAGEAVSTCDALLSLSICAAEYGYARPSVDHSDCIEILAGRHPVVERNLVGERFVPNDIRLNQTEAQVLILTGPNMAGKSTAMRQVALIVLMAQAGSFVPAKSARIGLVDRIFTRVGASDNLSRGQSTFLVEMTETANILHHATGMSLVLLDEIGRGTSTFDGLSIAWAVAEQLHERVGARTLFATHYHELTDLSREKSRVKNLSMAVKEGQGQIIFLRKLVEGGASRSYGIEVARLAGLPPEVVARAREILANLESAELDDAGRPRLVHALRSSPAEQLGLPFGIEAEVLAELSSLSLEATAPLEALNAIARWKARLEGKKIAGRAGP
jgi:DNA mismatch repair protein MutS